MITKQIKRLYCNLTPAEQKVADYAIEYPKDVTEMTVHQLAEKCGVASSAVVRFCKAVQLQGFSELKIVLPSRLKKELTDLSEAVVAGKDIRNDEVLSKHADWVEELKKQYTFTEETAMDILLQQTGKVFAQVLEDAGVYKNTPDGRAAFDKFVAYVNQEG